MRANIFYFFINSIIYISKKREIKLGIFSFCNALNFHIINESSLSLHPTSHHLHIIIDFYNYILPLILMLMEMKIEDCEWEREREAKIYIYKLKMCFLNNIINVTAFLCAKKFILFVFLVHFFMFSSFFLL